MTLLFRKASAEDLPAVARLANRAIDSLNGNGIYQWDELYPTREDFAEDIRNGQLRVGLADGQLAVVYTLNQDSDPAYGDGAWQYPGEPYYVLHRLIVDPAFQHQGVGTATMLHIEEELRDKEVHVLRLDAFTENPYSLRMYRSLGYREAGFAHWRKGRFVLMEKKF